MVSVRLSLILIAPTCDEKDVGEAWVAHQWVKRIAERHNVTLLTYHKRGKIPASCQLSGLRVIEWSEPPGLGRFERFNSMMKPGYAPFYVRARRWLRTAQRSGERFDLVHQLLPVAPRYPCPAVGLNLPIVMGPIGGALASPPGFEVDGDSSPWYVGLRQLDQLRLRRDPLLRRTYEEAVCVIGIAPYVLDILRDCKLRRFEVMSETGIETIPPPVDRSVQRDRCHILFVGRVVRAKGVREAIRAVGQLSDILLTFDIVGDGIDRPACESLVSELGLQDRVRFHGRIQRKDVDAFYRDADLFLFPSYREPGGNAVFEAMSFGLPLVVADRGGPGHAVDDKSGIRVPSEVAEQFVQGLSSATRELLTNPERRAAMGRAARDRVAEVALWDNKVQDLDRLYADLIS